MTYGAVVKGTFRARPNRFIAQVDTEEGTQICHVKNTGRCKELLVPGATVYLAEGKNPARKTSAVSLRLSPIDVLGMLAVLVLLVLSFVIQ